MKKEQLGSSQKSQRWDLYDFPVVGKPNSVTMFMPNVTMLLINFQQRRNVIHLNLENVVTSRLLDMVGNMKRCDVT